MTMRGTGVNPPRFTRASLRGAELPQGSNRGRRLVWQGGHVACLAVLLGPSARPEPVRATYGGSGGFGPGGPHDAGGSDAAAASMSFSPTAVITGTPTRTSANVASGSLDLVLAMTAHDTQKMTKTTTALARLNLDACLHFDLNNFDLNMR